MMQLRLSVLLGLASLAVPAAAAEPAGRAVVVRGSVTLQSSDGGSRALAPGDFVYAGDGVSTEADAHVRLLMTDKSLLDLGSKSSIRVAEYALASNNRKANVKVVAGRLWARVRTWFGGESSYQVEGANAVAGVRGTELI